MTTDNEKTEVKEIDINQIIEIVTPFDEFEHEPLLAEIQGNILKSHGRNHTVHLFLKFKDNIPAAKRWIGSFSHRYVTSALEQAEQAKQYRQNKDVPGKIFANFFLTRAGYMHLGYNYEQLPVDNPFRQGMKDFNVQNELGDDVEQWEDRFKNSEIHALVLLAADRIGNPRTYEAKLAEQEDQTNLCNQPALLVQKVEALKQELAAIADVVNEDIGYVLRHQKTGEEIEHFGFRDGVSQPLFLKRDIDRERRHNDFDKWDPRAPLSLVLFKDPLGKKAQSYGSFLVYRKLEQNVAGWNNDVVNNLAKKLNVPADLAGAYTMGRFQDGTPIADRKTPIGNTSDPEDNNFNYQDDKQGLKCPFHAHTRKLNPRGDSPVPLEEEKMHRIVRRGINYGHLPSEEPTEDAGLLFMCFQANLANQFNFIQKAWAKERNFVKPDVGSDVVIGVEKKNDQGQVVTETYNWPTNWGTEGQTEADFSHWVTMKGGEYFFAPSISFLKSLAPEPSCNIVVFRGVPKQEIEAALNMIAELKNYKQRNWGIGLNGETSEPDGFLRFFDQRKLPFEFYVRSPQLAVGEPSAYDNNIAMLNRYIKDVCHQEIEASEYKIAELKEYQELCWAIGLNRDTSEPDGFVRFFGERELPFKFFVQSPNVAVGDHYAYEQNIATLENYITTLNNYISDLKHVRLVAKHSGKVLSVANRSTAVANVVQYTRDDNEPSQLWLLEAAGDGYNYLVAKHSGKALDVPEFSQEDGKSVIQYDHNGGDNQKWKLESTGDGYYYLVAKHSSKVLDVADYSQGDGTNVIQYNKSGGDNQKWKLEDA